MKGIPGYREVPIELKSLFPEKPQFTTHAIANRIKRLRDAFQHMDERVLNETIPKGGFFMLMATGPETPVIDSDQPNQTLKVVDRLTIGSEEVLFADLVAWLHEMGQCAEVVSRYERPNKPAG